MSNNNEYNPLLLPGPKRLKMKKRFKKLASNLTTPQQQIQFQEYTKRKMKIDHELGFLMHELWNRKRRTNQNKPYLGDYYEMAFEAYLLKTKIPRVVPKLNRRSTKMLLSARAIECLKFLERIAKKKHQSLATVIEESIRMFLDLPENYLGINFQRKEKIERLG